MRNRSEFADRVGTQQDDLIAYIITLSTRGNPDDLESDLDILGIRHKRVEALDGAHLDLESLSRSSYDAARAKARVGFELSPRMVACGLSHRRAYEAFLASPASVALILEDDVRMTTERGILGDLANAFSQERATVLQLFCRGIGFCDPSREAEEIDGICLFDFAYVPAQTAAYLVNRSGAALALEGPLDGVADWPSWASRVRFRGVSPWQAWESDLETTIPVPVAQRGAEMLPVVFGLDFLRRRGSFSGTLEYLYRRALPVVESAVWRMRGRPTRGRSSLGPMLPLPGLGPGRRWVARRVRGW